MGIASSTAKSSSRRMRQVVRMEVATKATSKTQGRQANTDEEKRMKHEMGIESTAGDWQPEVGDEDMPRQRGEAMKCPKCSWVPPPEAPSKRMASLADRHWKDCMGIKRTKPGMNCRKGRVGLASTAALNRAAAMKRFTTWRRETCDSQLMEAATCMPNLEVPTWKQKEGY